LPHGDQRDKSPTLAPHRGEILEINRQGPLSRPLFDGFGSKAEPAAELEKAESKAVDGEKPICPVVQERLPNGWTKQAVKRITGKKMTDRIEKHNFYFKFNYYSLKLHVIKLFHEFGNI